MINKKNHIYKLMFCIIVKKVHSVRGRLAAEAVGGWSKNITSCCQGKCANDDMERWGRIEESFVQVEIGILGLVLVVEDGSSNV